MVLSREQKGFNRIRLAKRIGKNPSRSCDIERGDVEARMIAVNAANPIHVTERDVTDAAVRSSRGWKPEREMAATCEGRTAMNVEMYIFGSGKTFDVTLNRMGMTGRSI